MPIINPFRDKLTGAEVPFFEGSGSVFDDPRPCPWGHVSIDQRVIPAFENPELISDVHVFVLKIDDQPSHSQWRLNGTWHEHTFVQGDIGIYPAGLVDRMRSKDMRRSIMASIDQSAIAQTCAGFEVPDDFEFRTVLPAKDDFIKACLIALSQEAQIGYQSGELYGEAITTSLAAHYLLRYGTRKVKLNEPRGGLSKAALELVTEYMEAHAHERIRLSELAALAHLSPYHFSRLFKVSTGLSPYQYLMRTRVKQARRMMDKGEMTLKEISQRVGFYDASHFSRVFKRVTGVKAVEIARHIAE
jgi:AraC family transcriptional regulator